MTKQAVKQIGDGITVEVLEGEIEDRPVVAMRVAADDGVDYLIFDEEQPLVQLSLALLKAAWRMPHGKGGE